MLLVWYNQKYNEFKVKYIKHWFNSNYSVGMVDYYSQQLTTLMFEYKNKLYIFTSDNAFSEFLKKEYERERKEEKERENRKLKNKINKFSTKILLKLLSFTTKERYISEKDYNKTINYYNEELKKKDRFLRVFYKNGNKF